MTDKIEYPAARVLIVDDDEILREAASQSLIDAGFEVFNAHNGLRAIEILEACQPEIILMDVMMPEMDGFEATHAIRRLPALGQVPILIMTALDDVDSINRAFEVGATDFITKPIQTVILVERIRFTIRAVRMMIERRKLQEELAQAQKMEALGTLAGGVAHDLNNVLGGIVSYPDLLLYQLPKESPLRKPLETRLARWSEQAARIIQEGEVEELKGRALAIGALGRLISEIMEEAAENPELQEFVQEMVSQQGMGMATSALDNARSVTITADDAAEGLLRWLLRRTPRRDLPPSPVEGQPQTMYILKAKVESEEDDG